METAIANASGARSKASFTLARTVRVLLFGLIGVLYAGALILSYQLVEPGPFEALLIALLPFIPTLLSVLILRHQPGHTVGYLFLIMAAALILQVGAAGAYELSQRIAIPFYPLMESVTLILAETLYVPAIVIPLFLIPLYFPDGRLLSPRWRPLVALILLQIIWPFIAAAIHPWPSPWMQIATTRAWNGIPGSEPLVGAIGQFLGSLWPAVPPLLFVALFLRYRRLSGPERRQMQLPIFTIAGVILLALVVWFSPLTDLDQQSTFMITWFLVTLIPVSFGLAILGRGLWDIDIIVSRTLVYSGLSAAIVGIYAAVVFITGVLFTARANVYGGLIGAVIIAVLFQPLRDRLQRRVNHLLYGRRDDPVGLLTDLARRLESADGPDHIFTTLVETVAGALRLPHVSIALPPGGHDQARPHVDQWETVATAGKPTSQTRVIPLLYQNREIGRLQVAPRGPGEQFSPEDERLIATIAQISATVVHAAFLSTALQASRRQIVTSREEERRRLRRDLHDGLGPVLASVALQADTARDLVDSDTAETKAILDTIMEQAQTAVRDVRLLVHGLRPPALDELGLVGAIRQMAEPYKHQLALTIEAAEPLPPLSAALEVAAYRIVQEAVHNAVKHARAHRCLIVIEGDERLLLKITDDGIGLADNVTSGVGLLSMKERAEEVGGHCLVECLPAGGTQVFAMLPLPGDEGP